MDAADLHAAHERARRAVALLDTAAALVEQARRGLLAAADARRNVDTWRRLDALPLSALKETAGGKLRVSSFEAAGIGSVGALLRFGERQLDDGVPGVGPKTAHDAVEAATRLYWGVARQARALPEVGTPDAAAPPAVALLDAARRFERADRRLGPGVAYAPQIRPRLAQAIDVLGQAPGRLGWVFRGAASREQLEAAALDVARVLDDTAVAGFLTDLAGAVTEVRTFRPVAPAEVLADFAARPADFAAVLDRAGTAAGTAATVERIRGGLSGAIAERVEGITLDLTGLDVSLRGYQEFGVKYLVAQRRVILGDEMGLGKTLQAIGALCHVRAAEAGTHFLVVAPASVLPNWERELQQRSDLPTIVCHGDDRADELATWHRQGGVAVTSYDTLRLLGPPAPDGPVPHVVVVDEAHYVKNPAAARSQVVAAWLGVSPRTVLMSGTPMENRVDEFLHLVRLAQPPVAEALGRPDNHAALVGAGPEGFREQVAPVYLRRNQEDVLTELPELIEVDEWLDLTPADAAAYRDAVVAGEMMAMRQAATLGTASPADPSAKVRRLTELLEQYAAEERKVLVFSFFRHVIDAVVYVARPFHTDGAVVPVITGDVAPAQRQERIDEFQARPGFGVLAAQIDAGGVGLNLQAASVVVLMEPQWKPGTEAQAIARAHRMGQTRRVVVHRLLARRAVDETMVALLAEKKKLFDQLVRESAVAAASDDAVDPTVLLADESAAGQSLQTQVLEAERARLGLTPAAPSVATPAAPSA